jgi:hypothetical protein
MSLLPQKIEISDAYPNPSSDIARIGFAKLWTSISEFFEKPELDVASSTTCDIGGQLSTKLRITGTTTITSFGTNYRGPIQIRMAGALTIAHNATTLICPGNANLITTAGDTLTAWPKSTTSGTADGWQVVRLGHGLGIGQTWQNVTASRAIATTYTNSTGRPIQLSVAVAINAASAWINLVVDGNTIALSAGTYAAGARAEITGVVIPAGSAYSVTVSAGTATIQTWFELR